MKLIRKNKKGFTLVELIVVIAILAILALILIPAITGYVSKANDSKDQANARAIYSAAMLKLNTDEVDTPYTNALLTTAVAEETGVSEDTFSVTIGEDRRTVTVTYGNYSFNGKDFAPVTKP